MTDSSWYEYDWWGGLVAAAPGTKANIISCSNDIGCRLLLAVYIETQS